MFLWQIVMIKILPSYFRKYIKILPCYRLSFESQVSLSFLLSILFPAGSNFFNILCTLSVPHTSLLHGLSWETFPSIIQILHLQLGLCHLSCEKVSISQKCVKQIPSCLGHLVRHGSVGKRLEIVYPIPRGAAPIPGLVVDLWVCLLTFFSHELLNILHFLTV